MNLYEDTVEGSKHLKVVFVVVNREEEEKGGEAQKVVSLLLMSKCCTCREQRGADHRTKRVDSFQIIHPKDPLLC